MHTDIHTYTHTEQASMYKHTHKYACETHGVDLQKKTFYKKHMPLHILPTHTHIQT